MINFKLDLKSGVPFYRQIVDQIKYGIMSGQFSIGEQLPTVRSLSVELKINPNTITKAYKELEVQDILEGQQGTGTFISSSSVKISKKERTVKLNRICTEFVTIAMTYGFKIPEMVDELNKIERKRK